MIKRLMSLLGALALLLSLAGCAPALPAPENLRLDTLSNALVWDGVAGAAHYIVNDGDLN